jgi:hypothetical protein
VPSPKHDLFYIPVLHRLSVCSLLWEFTLMFYL